MQLYLLRHGIAEPPSYSQPDASRSLTPEGVAQLRSQAQAYRRAGFRISQICTSPLLRARQTGEIIASFLGVQTQVEPLLKPGCTLEDVEELMGRFESSDHVLLIGHQPYLGGLVRLLTGGVVKMRTGMIAVIETVDVRPGHGVLLGLYDPDVMAQLA